MTSCTHWDGAEKRRCGASTGTRDCTRRAREAGIEIVEVTA